MIPRSIEAATDGLSAMACMLLLRLYARADKHGEMANAGHLPRGWSRANRVACLDELVLAGLITVHDNGSITLVEWTPGGVS